MYEVGQANCMQMFAAKSKKFAVRAVEADQVTITIYGREGNRHELEKIFRLSPKRDLVASIQTGNPIPSGLAFFETVCNALEGLQHFRPPVNWSHRLTER